MGYNVSFLLTVQDIPIAAMDVLRTTMDMLGSTMVLL